MARTRAPERIHQIVDAALSVFLERGYRRARMADVAEAAGVSPGLLYTYAANKEALFQLVILRELGVELDSVDLPAPAPRPQEIQTLIRRALRDLGAIPSLDAAEAVERPVDVRAELESIVGEHYDRVHQYRHLIKLIERSALDWPELSDRFYQQSRRPFVRRLGLYIGRRVDAGHLSAIPDPEVAARFVIETVAWFANHRYRDYDGAQINDDTARATVVQLVSVGLMGTTRRQP